MKKSKDEQLFKFMTGQYKRVHVVRGQEMIQIELDEVGGLDDGSLVDCDPDDSTGTWEKIIPFHAIAFIENLPGEED